MAFSDPHEALNFGKVRFSLSIYTHICMYLCVYMFLHNQIIFSYIFMILNIKRVALNTYFILNLCIMYLYLYIICIHI